MYFLDVMIFDPTLTKYILTDPTKLDSFFQLLSCEIEHTKLEWEFLWIIKKKNIAFLQVQISRTPYKDMLKYRRASVRNCCLSDFS